MGRPKSLVPKIYIDRSRGRAFTKLDGKFVTLGPAGSVEAQQRYAEVLQAHAAGRLAAHEHSRQSSGQAAPLTINELFLQFATREFPRLSRSEQLCFKSAMRVCRQLFGSTDVRDFGPVRFRTMRDAMVQGAKGSTLPPGSDGTPARDRKPWCRKTANRQAKRVRAVFRWGVSWELWMCCGRPCNSGPVVWLAGSQTHLLQDGRFTCGANRCAVGCDSKSGQRLALTPRARRMLMGIRATN